MFVKLLQGKKHVVGMTGDGVNDAPALKQAECGVAVSNATGTRRSSHLSSPSFVLDVAKKAASHEGVLIPEGLSGITYLIEEGRRIHARLLTSIIKLVMKSKCHFFVASISLALALSLFFSFSLVFFFFLKLLRFFVLATS